MLDRQKGKLVYNCDGQGCHEFLETETGDFEKAREMFKRAGWAAQRQGNEWEHFCPSCK